LKGGREETPGLPVDPLELRHGFLLTRDAMLTDECEWDEASRTALPAYLDGLEHVADVTPLKSEATVRPASTQAST
jgi:hypothetical protein